jgi:hypothetical protein
MCSKALGTTVDMFSSIAVSVAKRSAFGLLRLFSEQRQVLGMEVWIMANTKAGDEAFENLLDALKLLKNTDHLRFRRVQRHLRRLIVADNAAAVYVPEIKACILGYSYVRDSSPARLAAAIVHEATHARVRNNGLPYTPKNWAREEVLCVSESLSFLDQVSGANGEVEAANLRESVVAEMQADRPWFTESRRWDLFAEDMRRAGYPEWFIRIRGRRRSDS